MNFKAVFHLLSLVLVFMSGFLLFSAGLGWAYGDAPAAVHGLLYSAAVGFTVGVLLFLFTRCKAELSRRDGFAIVVIGWLITSLIGALPYYFSGIIPDFIGALFESMSGFTTTGASVMTNLESVPRSILFWRSLTHLIGGMGVLVLCVAILPFLGVGGMQLYRAEMSGPSKDRLAPRIATTAKLLWGVYMLLILLESVLLRLAGMDWFDAVCHSMATVATGGFSTRTDSIAAYDSRSIETIIMVFMFLAGVNFALHYRALLGDVKSYFKNSECRFYMGWMAACSLAIAFLLYLQNIYPSFLSSLRYSTFQVLSIGTTTGFVTADYDVWPMGCLLILLLLMLTGACAGSTTGAIKNIRIVIVFKKIKREIKLFMQPQAVFRIKINDEPLEQDVISNVSAFVIAYLLVFVLALFAMSFYCKDFMTASSSVLATLGCVGPGLAQAGPMENYSGFPAVAKGILIVCMLLGRLELYSVLVLLLPSFWKK